MVGVAPAIVDDDGNDESHEVENDEEGDDPSVLSLVPPLLRVQGFEEGHPLALFFPKFVRGGGVDGETGLWRQWWRLEVDFDVGVVFGGGLCH